MNDDFQDFIKDSSKSPSKEISNSVLAKIQKELDPSPWSVFTKLLTIQAFIGVITMLFCPQFTLSLTNNHKAYHYFHYNFGEQICMLICGSIFIGTGAVFASFILKSPEVSKIRDSKFLYFFSLCSIALLVFMLSGAELYLKLTSFWLIGAYISGLILFELGSFIRIQLSVK